MENMIRKLADLPATLDEKSLKEYKDSGLNTYVLTEDFADMGSPEYLNALLVCEKIGLDVFIRGYNSERYFDKCKINYNEYPCVKGFYLWDEPNFSQFEKVKELIPFMAEKYPTKHWHINLFPSYAGEGLKVEPYDPETAHRIYVEKYVDVVLNNVKNEKDISLDVYPLGRDKNGGYYLYLKWLSDLYTIAIGAKKSNCSMNACIQVYDDSGVKFPESSADIRLQCYTSLAFGADSFEFYQYGPFGQCKGMLDLDRKPNKAYYFVQEVLREIEFFEREYLKFSWVGVSVFNDNKVEASLDYIKEKTISPIGINRVETSAGLLIGNFINEDKNGYVIVNYCEPSKKIVNDIKISFAKDKSISVYSGSKVFKVKASELSFSLNAGEGIFLITE